MHRSSTILLLVICLIFTACSPAIPPLATQTNTPKQTVPVSSIHTATSTIFQPSATVSATKTAPVPETTPTPERNSPTPNQATPLPADATIQVTPPQEGIPVSPFRRNQLVYRQTYRIEPSSIPGWNQVTNLEYGFTFRYPARLHLTTSGNFVWVSLENADLYFGFRRPDDSMSFNVIKNQYIFYLPGNGGDIQGEVTARDALKIKGLQISRSAVRISNRDWFILYNNGEEFEVKKTAGGAQVGRLLLSGIVESTINPFDPPDNYKGITPAVQRLADQIFATFDFQTYAFSGWQTYSDPDFGLSFEYPTEWDAINQWDQAQSYGSPNAIIKREEFSGAGGMIDLDIWDAHNLKMADWQNWWHEWTGAPREGYEPKEPNAQVFKMPAMLYVAPMEQAYDELTLFFTDGKFIYRLMYMMQDQRIGLQVFFRMVNTLKSKSLGPANAVLPVLNID